jgi:hypothetical protein
MIHFMQLLPNNFRSLTLLAALTSGLLLSSTAAASSLLPGEAGNFTILGLEGGSVIINSATSVSGDVGYSKNVTSNTNQKIDNFDGTAYVHSTTTFTHTAATYAPSGGIVTGGSADSLLEQANADATQASINFAGLTPTTVLGALGDNDSRVLISTGDLNVFSLDSLIYKEDTLELVSRSGFDDQFVFNVLGNFYFDNSEIKLTGVSTEHVVFNFLNASDIKIGKAGTIFMGAILAVTGSVDYHNPATFNGSIIALDINLHSDFNIAGPINPVPVPAAFWLFGSALIGFVGFSKRRKVA